MARKGLLDGVHPDVVVAMLREHQETVNRERRERAKASKTGTRKGRNWWYGQHEGRIQLVLEWGHNGSVYAVTRVVSRFDAEESYLGLRRICARVWREMRQIRRESKAGLSPKSKPTTVSVASFDQLPTMFPSS